tara:strand:+ start:478 stop:1308 length:831 start_codon:yes stop_codon:yes gene_type:complete
MRFMNCSEATFEFFGDIYLWKDVFVNRNNKLPKVKNFVEDLLEFGKINVETGIHNATNAFRRETFVTMNTCYICNKFYSDLKYTYLDSFIGKYLLYGWIHCKDCKQFAIKDKDRRELNLEVLPLSTYTYLSDTKLNFMYKKCNNIYKIIKSLGLSIGHQDCIFIHYKYKILTASVYWYTDKNGLSKLMEIPFSNLIFHNRNIFGYSYENSINNILKKSHHFQNTNWKNKWVKKFKKEYSKANTWEEYYKVSIRKGIPKETNLLILDFLGYFYLRKI